MSTKTFEQEFRARLDALEKDMAEVGENWTSVCRATGISRATPDRWRDATPNTVLLMDVMAGYVANRRASLVAQALVAPKP